MASAKTIRLADYSVVELNALQSQIAQELRRRAAREKKDVLIKIKALAASSGFTLDEILAQSPADDKSAGTTRSVAPKFRHPVDPSLTWTGRGKKPKWVAEALANGRKIEDLLIRS